MNLNKVIGKKDGKMLPKEPTKVFVCTLSGITDGEASKMLIIDALNGIGEKKIR